MKDPRVEILIDELVLHGFSPADRYAIGEALSMELQRLVIAGNPADLANLGNTQLLRTNNVTLKTGEKSQVIGAQVAKAIHGSLGLRSQRGIK